MSVLNGNPVVENLRRPKRKLFKVDFYRDDWSQVLDLDPMTTHEVMMTLEEWCQEHHAAMSNRTPFNQAMREATEVTVRLIHTVEGGGK